MNEADAQVCIGVCLPSLHLVPQEWDIRVTSKELINGVDRPLLGAKQKLVSRVLYEQRQVAEASGKGSKTTRRRHGEHGTVCRGAGAQGLSDGAGDRDTLARCSQRPARTRHNPLDGAGTRDAPAWPRRVRTRHKVESTLFLQERYRLRGGLGEKRSNYRGARCDL